ncbi:hypothetical protein GG344DRAFT_70868 [Lentinula edodes]|nr:hypothetical protein GG344DRAFT_70868 [Lentinula edodes]
MSDLELASCVYSMQCGAEGRDMWLRLGCPSDDLTKMATTRPTWYQRVASSRGQNLSAGRSTISNPSPAFRYLHSNSPASINCTGPPFDDVFLSLDIRPCLCFDGIISSSAQSWLNGPQLSSTNGATIEVTFLGHSADSKWTKTAQNDAQVGVIKTLRDAWENYHLQDVASKDVKFHGFVTKAQVATAIYTRSSFRELEHTLGNVKGGWWWISGTAQGQRKQ